MKKHNSDEKEVCKWKKHIYKTICPKFHDAGHPYWAIPENLEGFKYCPYCGGKIVIVDRKK